METAKYNIYFIGLIIWHILISCGFENDTIPDDPEFAIEFSNDAIINEKDIVFYDSSTCFLFLNKEIEFTIGTGTEFPPYIFTEFSVLVNKNIIYQGIVYPSTYFNMPPNLYIFSKTYPTFRSDILPIIGHGFLKDTLNDYRIIESLKKSNLLHHGITCTIDNIKISSDNDSTIICTITFKNNDQVNYFIPDPEKMDMLDFNVVVNISLTNKETDEHFHLAGNYDNFYWDITMDDLSIMESNGEVTYTYTTACNTAIKKGLYDCHIGVSTSITNFSTFITIPLEQESGRIWIGHTSSSIKNMIIE